MTRFVYPRREWWRHATKARIWRSQQFVVKCDDCHEKPGIQVTDVYWMCSDCSRRYLERLEAERI